MLRHASAGVLLALLCGTALADVPRAETNADLTMGQFWLVLQEVGTPAVLPGWPDAAAALRRRPPAAFRATDGYEADGKPDARLRRAVRKAQVALWVASPAPAPRDLAAEEPR